MSKFPRILLVLLLFAATVLHGAVTAEHLKEQSASVTAEKYPNADSVLLFEFTHAVYQTDGTAVETDEYYQKVLTEAGRRGMRELTFEFNTTYETFDVPVLEVIKPDGDVVKIDVASNSRVAIDPSQMGANIYDPANKLLAVTIPKLEIGDIVHVLSRETIKKARMPGVWSNIYILQADVPFLHCEVKIDAPESHPLQAIRLKNEEKGSVQFSETKKDGRILYTWTIENVPQVVPEPNMPPLYLCVQRLLVSTVKSWPEISRWYYNICRPRLDAVTPEIRAKVEELIRDAKTSDEKIMALFQFVSQQIRYMGITVETEAPGYEPHDVSMTFQQRYGVCRDKAALLVSMLELAGFHAYPVLFMWGYPKDDEVPNSYFNHAIAAVEDAPGHYILMDPTCETTAELLPSTMANMSYLPAKPQGEALLRSPLVPAEKNLLEIKTEASIAPDGTLHGRSVIDFLGVNDKMYRDAFSRWPLDYRRQFFAARLKRAMAGAELETLKVFPENVRDMSFPLKVEMTYRVEESLPAGTEAFLLELPCFGTEFGAANFVLGSVGLKKRRFPMQLFSTCGVSEQFQLTLPPNCRILSLPPEVAVHAPGIMKYRRTLKSEGASLLGASDVVFNTVELSPDGYDELKKALAEIDAVGEQLPVARPDYSGAAATKAAEAFPAADTILLDASVDVKLKDDSNWIQTERSVRKILNYAGVKDYSELKIAYNPIWESVEIKAVVTAPDGTKKELSPEEINVMDASWVATAPRYPAGKLLVASLPGVVPGSVIDATVTRNCKDRPFFSLTAVFAEGFPIVGKRVAVECPKKLRFRYASAQNGVTFQERFDGDRARYVWSATDVPQLPSEPGRPPLWMFAPSVMLSSGDLAVFGRELSSALTEKTLNAPKAAELVRALAPESMPLEERICAIRTWVARNIRLAGPELDELPWSAFSPADMTLQAGYGDSADRAILLGAMLKASGIEFSFVAAMDLGCTEEATRRLSRAPQNFFSKILLYLPGVDSYLNDTDEYASLGSTASEEAIGLSLDAGRLIAIHPRRKGESSTSRSYRIRLHVDGSAQIEASFLYSGLPYSSMRRLFKEMTPAESQQFFESLAAGISQEARYKGKPNAAFDEYPGKLTFTLDVPHFATGSGNYLQFSLPGFSTLSSGVGTALSTRRTPLWRGKSEKTLFEYRIELPENFVPLGLGPERFELGRPGSAAFFRRMEEIPGAIRLEYSLTLPVESLPPAEYGRLVELQKELSKLSMSRIILKQRGGKP